MKNLKFANMLKEKREAAGYNQTMVADALFLSRSTYHHYESGLRIPPIEVIMRLAALYCVNPLEFFSTFIPGDITEENPTYHKFLFSGKYALTTRELRFITLFGKLSSKEQENILQMMHLLKSAHNAD